MKIFVFGVAVWAVTAVCATAADSITNAPRRPSAGNAGRIPAVIFDTDMGSDCDDAGALALLHALADEGKVRILGVIYSSGKVREGVGVCDAINTYYGRGDLPLGQYRADDVGDGRGLYAVQVARARARYGHDVVAEAPALVDAYRAMLAAEPDGNVTLLTVGHPHGLVHLMRDAAGLRLVEAKVRRWVAMGGSWNFGKCGSDVYMAELLERWPKDLFVSLRGAAVTTGHRLLPATPVDNPVREAYRLFGNALVKGRASWDQLAVLFAVHPERFDVAAHGAHQRVAAGRTVWNPQVNHSRHYLVTPKGDDAALARVIEDFMSRVPRGQGQGR